LHHVLINTGHQRADDLVEGERAVLHLICTSEGITARITPGLAAFLELQGDGAAFDDGHLGAHVTKGDQRPLCAGQTGLTTRCTWFLCRCDCRCLCESKHALSVV